MNYALATHQNSRCFQRMNCQLKCENLHYEAQSRRYN